MESRALKTQSHRLFRGVKGVADDGVLDSGEVDANLVSPAGLGLGFHEGERLLILGFA